MSYGLNSLKGIIRVLLWGLLRVIQGVWTIARMGYSYDYGEFHILCTAWRLYL